MKKRFAHIGSYHRNLGDNIALLNVRKEFDNQYSDIEWYNLDIGMFWNKKNNVQFVKEFFKQNAFDAIVVGGGGLIEYRGYEQKNFVKNNDFKTTTKKKNSYKKS